MDKVITIPDEKVEKLKIEAVKMKMSFKEYLEYLLFGHQKKKKK